MIIIIWSIRISKLISPIRQFIKKYVEICDFRFNLCKIVPPFSHGLLYHVYLPYPLVISPPPPPESIILGALLSPSGNPLKYALKWVRNYYPALYFKSVVSINLKIFETIMKDNLKIMTSCSKLISDSGITFLYSQKLLKD